MNQASIEAARRRTFAIISHPDAGKTTLTEKLLLYGGAIQLAGTVKDRRNERRTTSDWMELEKQRGISITSTVLQFDYEGLVINLLDTPGHDDFSADTYRTLTAADCALMLIDNAKGVETQTKKLFAVCRQRGIPIFTFVNKMDHHGKGPLALLTEVEDTLGIMSVPLNWPIGQGRSFKGVYDRQTNEVHIYSRSSHGATRAHVEVLKIDDPRLLGILGEERLHTLLEDRELLEVAGESLDLDRVLAGDMTPVFFGSALANFGVELFLKRFIEMAPSPRPRLAGAEAVRPEEPFSGFVFKIQANMDPKHRDRIAFMRVVSGKFEKDMQVVHVRTGKELRLTRPQRLFADDRETVEEAFPGDIVGLTNPGAFRLGDTLSAAPMASFEEVPPFQPETFAVIRNQDVSRYKHFDKGIKQLCEEGLVDLFYDMGAHGHDPILGAVGRLQFEVVQHRLQSEYGVRTTTEPLSFEMIRWIDCTEEQLQGRSWHGTRLVYDVNHRPALLISNDWSLRWIQDKNPDVSFLLRGQV